ncbi:helix-turn-helix domain-containing protein [Secundilactobacillus kimchicus]|uniref:helix-turn-helix domain-containing protein n=1 Tax=Secundilactobacillus kimchicus TaxID=528209 RepID=UPI0024A9CCAD|nr:helix-turn-helix domain-containing protein [Secundilactobacillus kimchicus]
MTKSAMKPRVRTVVETARILKTRNTNVYKLIKSGKLKALKLGNMSVPDSEIDRFIDTYKGKTLKEILEDEE